MFDLIWTVSVVLIVPLAISGLFYWRASIALDHRMDELDRLIHQLARVVNDPGSIVLNRDGSVTIQAVASAEQGQSAGVVAVKAKIESIEPETIERRESGQDTDRRRS